MRLLKLFISFLYYLFNATKRTIYNVLGVKNKPICVTLYYHSIFNEEKGVFKKQTDLISKKSNAIKSDYFGKLESDKLYTILTFDDAFENVFLNAVPILEEKKIPFTIFFISDYFGRKPDWEYPEGNKDMHERIMTIDQAQSLPSSLLTIGSHTKSHKKLTSLNIDDVFSELSDSKAALENIFGQSVNVFSFPNGEYNKEIMNQCLNVGYKRLFTIDPKLSLQKAGERITGRTWANGNDWYPEFWLKVHGGYSWLDSAFKLKRKLLKLTN